MNTSRSSACTNTEDKSRETTSHKAAQTASSLGELARHDGHNLYYFLYKRLGNTHEAEDLVQQTYEEALRHIESFKGDCELRTWVYGIASNLLKNHLNRSPSRRYEFAPEEMLEELIAEEQTPEERVSQMDLLGKLGRSLEELPEEMRLTIMLVLVEEKSYADAAVMQNVPVGTIRSRVCRARKILREKLGLPSSSSADEIREIDDGIPHPATTAATSSLKARKLRPRERIKKTYPHDFGTAWVSEDQWRMAGEVLKHKQIEAQTRLRQVRSSSLYSSQLEYLAVIQTALNVLSRSHVRSVFTH